MKKRWLRRLIYFVVVAGTAGFAFYQHKESQKENQAEEKKRFGFFFFGNVSSAKCFY